MTRPARIAALVAALAITTAAGFVGGYLVATPNDFELRGTLTLDSEIQLGQDASCSGKQTFEDVHEGAQVIVTDGAGATIAIGRLGAGAVRLNVDCEFAIQVADVPAGRRIYGVAIPGHGDPVQVSEQDARNGGVKLVLGKL